MKEKGAPWLAYVLTLLCILTVTTSSLTIGAMAKYTASGAVSASAGVAKWDVRFGDVPAGVTGPRANNTVCYIRPAGSNTKTTGGPKYLYVYNYSDVSADVTMRLLYTSPSNSQTFPAATATTTWPTTNGQFLVVGTPHSTAGVTGNGTTKATIPPGGRAAFSITINGTPLGDITTASYYTSGSISPANNQNETFYLKAYANAVQVD